MPIYNIEIPVVFTVEARSHDDAKHKVISCSRDARESFILDEANCKHVTCQFRDIVRVQEVHADLKEIYNILR